MFFSIKIRVVMKVLVMKLQSICCILCFVFMFFYSVI